MLSLVHLPSAVAIFPGLLVHFWSVHESEFGISGRKLTLHLLLQYMCALGTFVNVADIYVVPNDELKEWFAACLFLIGTLGRSYSRMSGCTGTCVH